MLRRHHYGFGHIALRQLFFHNPSGLVAALMSRGCELLERIWDDIGDQVAEADGKAARLSSDGLACTPHEIGKDTVAVIVTMPRPQRVAEAYFLGLVLRRSSNRVEDLHGLEKGIARYVTLERGSNSAGEERTVLGEWAEEAHLNMGSGPEATLKAFARKLSEMAATHDENLP